VELVTCRFLDSSSYYESENPSIQGLLIQPGEILGDSIFIPLEIFSLSLMLFDARWMLEYQHDCLLVAPLTHHQ
jgi:hypothetical protein